MLGKQFIFSVIGVHGVWEEKVEVAQGRATETGKGLSTNTTHFYNPIQAPSPPKVFHKHLTPTETSISSESLYTPDVKPYTSIPNLR